MLVSDRTNDLAVHLFGPRRENVAAAQSRLDVRDRYTVIVGCQCARHGCRRVALDDDPGGLDFFQKLADLPEQPSRQMIQRLIGCHDVQVEVRDHLGQLQHLIK
ncbi:hypothetical protein ACVJGB_002738 [Bradyrhizobium liaoningense]